MAILFGVNSEDKSLLKKMEGLALSSETSFFRKNGISIGYSSDENIFFKEDSWELADGISIKWTKNKGLKIKRAYPDSAPIYYCREDSDFVFSTHINPLLPFLKRRNINKRTLDSFLTFRFNIYPHNTLLEKIKKLPPGWLLEKSDEGFKKKKVKDFQPSVKDKGEKYYAKELKENLKESVKNICENGGTPGILLSGGLDSSLLVGLTKKFKQHVNTYTLALSDKIPSECKNISNIFETKQRSIGDIKDPFKILPNLTWSSSLPVFDASMVPLFKLVNIASNNSDFILTGIGADEEFAGYEVDMACHYLQRYGQKNVGNFLSRLIDFIPSRFFNWLTNSDKNYRQHFKEKLKFSLRHPKNTSQIFEKLNAVFDFNSREKLYTSFNPDRHYKFIENYLNFGQDILNWLLYFEQRTKLQSQMLEPVYNFSSSLKPVKSPYLSESVLKISLEIPADLKLKGLRKKAILRKSAERILPEKIVSKQKSHFSPSLDRWLKGETLEISRQLLSERMLEKHGIFKSRYVKKILMEKGKSFLRNRMLWSLLAFQLWYEIYIDRKFNQPPKNIERLIHP